MNAPDPQDADDKPLTPTQQAVLNRARMIFAATMGLLVVGFIIIGGVVVYRASRSVAPTPPASAAVTAQSVLLPSGAEVISVVASGGTITATYRVGPAIQVRVFDAQGVLQRQFDVLTK